MLKNIMEDIVDDILNHIIQRKDLNICDCEQCILDIKTYVLNRIKPRYYDTSQGHVYSKTESLKNQLYVDIVEEIIHANNKISSNPRHSNNKND